MDSGLEGDLDFEIQLQVQTESVTLFSGAALAGGIAGDVAQRICGAAGYVTNGLANIIKREAVLLAILRRSLAPPAWLRGYRRVLLFLLVVVGHVL